MKWILSMAILAPWLLMNSAQATRCSELKCSNRLDKIKFENQTARFASPPVKYQCFTGGAFWPASGIGGWRCCCRQLAVKTDAGCAEGCLQHRQWTSSNCKKQGDGTNIRVTGTGWPWGKTRVKGWCHGPEWIPGP